MLPVKSLTTPIREYLVSGNSSNGSKSQQVTLLFIYFAKLNMIAAHFCRCVAIMHVDSKLGPAEPLVHWVKSSIYSYIIVC